MKTINELMEIIDINDIFFEKLELPNNVYGYYQNSNAESYILISDKVNLSNNESLYKCILAEEIGHYFTCIGNNVPHKSNSYHSDLLIEKQEVKAIKWATDYLIDTDLLLDYLRHNTMAKLSDIADHFQVTEDFIIRKLEFMKRKDCFWQLKDEIYLYLMDLPTIAIVDIWDPDFYEYLDSY